jgi:hypothetical protein
MVRPDGIPEDVWTKASADAAEFVEWLIPAPSDYAASEDVLAKVLARAIMAETERCAVLVRDYPDVIPMWSRGSAPPGNGPPRRATQAELAAAIRKGAQ